MKEYLDLIDTATTGGRYDVTPLFGNYHAFSALLDDLLELCREIEYDTVVGIDALGFILDTGEDNADAHMKRPIMGREGLVAVTNGRLDGFALPTRTF